MSAQWGFQAGTAQSDNAAVSYACQVGSKDHNTGNLHVSKQFWQIIPVTSNASPTPESKGNEFAAASRKSVQIAKSSPTQKNKSCRHSSKWLARHPAYVYQQGHHECQARLNSAHKRSLANRDLSKRDSTRYQM